MTTVYTCIPLDAGYGNALQQAYAKFPEVGTTFRISPRYNLTTGTSESGYPSSYLAKHVLPSLISKLSPMGTDGVAVGTGVGMGTQASRLPVRFEYFYVDPTPANCKWQLANVNDALAVDANGVIYIPGLKDSGEVFWNDIASTQDDAGNVTVTGGFHTRPVRVTLAIQCDHRVCGKAKTPQSGASMNVAPNTNGRQYSSRINTNFDRMIYIQQGKAGQKQIRNLSYPIPQTVLNGGGTKGTDGTAAPVTCVDGYPVPNTEANEPKIDTLADSTEDLDNNAEKIIQKYGKATSPCKLYIPKIIKTIKPGDMIAKVGNVIVNVCVQAVHLNYRQPQYTILECL